MSETIVSIPEKQIKLTKKGVNSLLEMLDPGEEATIKVGDKPNEYIVSIKIDGEYAGIFDFDDDEIIM